MNISCCLAALSVFAISRTDLPVEYTIRRDQLRMQTQGMPNELYWSDELILGTGAVLPARVEVTSKGNGTLTIANVKVRVFDDHDDGMVYLGGMLGTRFVDIDRDGYLDLLLSGIVEFTGEIAGSVTRREAVVTIYMFDPTTNRFTRTCFEGPSELQL